jgi:hypothetical protein
MTPPPAPLVATWLLEKLGTDQALLGDLIERYARGRSRRWFWRQALLALAIGTVKDIREHKVLTIRAVATALATASALGFVARMIIGFGPRPSYVFLLAGCLMNGVVGWVVGRLHRPHHGPMVLGLAAVALLLQGPEFVRVLSNAVQHPRFEPYLAGWFIHILPQTLSLLIGGIVSAPRSRTGAPGSAELI